MEKTILDWVALVLVIVGGLNWGLYGLLSVDLVSYLAIIHPLVATLVYTLVGLSAIYTIYFAIKE